MSDRVDRIQALMAAWAETPFAELRDAMESRDDLLTADDDVARFARTMATLIDPDVTFSVTAVEAYAVIWPRGEGSGLVDWLSLWRSWFSSWESISPGPGEIFEVGDTVIHQFNGDLVGRGSGVELHFSHYHLWRFEGDRVVEFTIEPTREDAEATAGR